MAANTSKFIRIRGAREHNLKDLSVDIPQGQFVVVTGVSGSGKSSLAFDVLAREGQRRYLETFSAFSRQFMGKLVPPDVDSIEGLSPVITIGQKTVGNNTRSTVGTLSDLYDLLRLLYARIGEAPESVQVSRSLFSFNAPAGACPQCNGLGLEEKIAINKLVADPAKTLREGALAPTLPNGYIMYSQVTVDVLNTVCEAHGFNVDIPWQDLTAEQQNVILNGSTRLKVPFGKHSLESRLKWTGIAAKPREEGHYKGMLPIMSDILKRDRNKNILRYVESLTCSVCNGKRLNADALSVTINGTRIDQLADMELTQLRQWLEGQQWTDSQRNIACAISEKLRQQIALLEQLGVGYLSLSRAAATLSGGESQRIRLVNQVTAKLSGVCYVFDEPSIGLHPRDNAALLRVLRMLVNNGNTVSVVEHDPVTIRQADWIVDIGPKAGVNGGELLFSGTLQSFLADKSLPAISPTRQWLDRNVAWQSPTKASPNIQIANAAVNNLKRVTANFCTGAFNVVTGVSGAGKSSLVHGVLQPAVKAHLAGAPVDHVTGLDAIQQLVTINQSPIGRTPRSNPATYTGMADRIRDLFAKQPAAKAAKFNKSRFSFNTKGGRCETCQGAGRTTIGMHFLGNVGVTCSTCNGKRFNDTTLAITYRGKSIAECYELSVDEAVGFFAEDKKLQQQLLTLQQLGLGYLTLGQPSTTLSGGEAQRIKLATELQHTRNRHTLYVLDEPTVGLHMADTEVLLKALRNLVDNGHTIICIEHDEQVIAQADWQVELGPDSGRQGGTIVYQGEPRIVEVSATQAAVKPVAGTTEVIKLKGVTTHQLKGIDVHIPKEKLTVITGVSGSGKSSLAFDTLFAEGHSRFTESMSTYTRSLLQQSNRAALESTQGLTPVVAIGRKHVNTSARSTVGTVSGILEHLRVACSRVAQLDGLPLLASHFSFNHQLGACPVCDGLGHQLLCDPEKLIEHPERSLLDGAFSKNKTAAFYANPDGQFIALAKAVAQHHNIDLSQPWQDLTIEQQQILRYGTGNTIWDVTWKFRNKSREGEQQLTKPWLGFCNYVNDEYTRKLHNKNIDSIKALLAEVTCETCNGSRYAASVNSTRIYGRTLPQLADLELGQLHEVLSSTDETLGEAGQAVLEAVRPALLRLLNVLHRLGLGYLTLARATSSLSGGEAQRLKLAGQFAAKLTGVTYVLDEPTIGLHDAATQTLLEVVCELIDANNTVVIVEHDAAVMRAADHLIELGPGAGHEGGNVVHQGTLESLLDSGKSVTAPYLKEGTARTPVTRESAGKAFGVKGATANNLQSVDVSFSSQQLIAVTGVSGSGKSSLVRDVLAASAKAGKAVHCSEVFGLDQFDRILSIDQRPMNTSILSTPATNTGMMDLLRDAFARTAAAKAAGLTKSAFSYLHKDGRCTSCNGMGAIKTSMDFMSDVWTPCESCNGLRYNDTVLQVRIHDHSIGDVLQLTIAEAATMWSDHPKLGKQLKTLVATGIGHLKLGQPTSTLSGGEAQRLKLANELLQPRTGSNLYVFDEPGTGLHFKDIDRLIDLFNALVDEGHTVLFVEHNQQLIGAANRIIELGPGSGSEGGTIIRNN